MLDKNHITPSEFWAIMFFAILLVVCALTLTDWGSIAAIVAAFVAVALVLRAIIRYIKHKHPFKVFHYLIPKREWEYLGKKYDNATN